MYINIESLLCHDCGTTSITPIMVIRSRTLSTSEMVETDINHFHADYPSSTGGKPLNIITAGDVRKSVVLFPVMILCWTKQANLVSVLSFILYYLNRRPVIKKSGMLFDPYMIIEYTAKEIVKIRHLLVEL